MKISSGENYPEMLQGIADTYIDRYKPENPDTTLARQYYLNAKFAQTLKRNSIALDYYNRSIDLFPDNAKVYYDRGYFKLTRLELNSDIAYNAVKDFDRAIILDPAFAKAYQSRALAVSYVGRHLRACLDYTKAKELDPELDVREGLEKNCSRINN